MRITTQAGGTSPVMTFDGFWDLVVAVLERLPAMHQHRAQEVARWMIDLRDRMKTLRSMPTSIERIAALYVELMEKTQGDYSLERQQAADTWIITGDRRYKTPKELTYDDLWPTRETYEKLCGVSVIPQAEHDRIVKKVAQESFQAGEKKGLAGAHEHGVPQPVLDEESLAAWKDEQRGQHEVLVGLLDNKAELNEKVDQLTRTLERELEQRTRNENTILRLTEELKFARAMNIPSESEGPF